MIWWVSYDCDHHGEDDDHGGGDGVDMTLSSCKYDGNDYSENDCHKNVNYQSLVETERSQY